MTEHPLYRRLAADIDCFEAAAQAFTQGELDKKAYKGISGGFGSYAQRDPAKHMLRLRMVGGHVTKEKLRFIAESVERWGITRLKLTTCQTVQLHDLPAGALGPLMRAALEAGIVTRGGGGDHPRSIMVSPLSGVEQGEYFDVRPWAETANAYLLSRMLDLHMPRKLKVAFANGPKNETHATFRDLGFLAQADGTFRVYCAGGLGPNPKMGVLVAEQAQPQDVAYYIDAMLRVFTAFGNYDNRARARTRYLQDTLGPEGLKAEFAKALQEARKEDLTEHCLPTVVDKQPDGQAAGPRVIAQKQPGLYAVSYHPIGGLLPPELPRALCETIREMPAVEVRIGPDETLYVINLAGREVPAVLAATQGGAETLFETSVACIGAAVCQQGVRDSQKLLRTLVEAARQAGFADGVLPRVHISGCPSSCGTHQVGTLGLVGGVKLVDKAPQPAFSVLLYGEAAAGRERFGTPLGAMLEEDLPAFFTALGNAVAAGNTTFAAWLPGHEEALRALAAPYLKA